MKVARLSSIGMLAKSEREGERESSYQLPPSQPRRLRVRASWVWRWYWRCAASCLRMQHLQDYTPHCHRLRGQVSSHLGWRAARNMVFAFDTCKGSVIRASGCRT
ncbi:hypothetical protein OH77DRAFT_857157 [Trametes cingulata]|nr:hypothetical protein OH77DRAFT_857157 [Trametes cingulata]